MDPIEYARRRRLELVQRALRRGNPKLRASRISHGGTVSAASGVLQLIIGGSTVSRHLRHCGAALTLEWLISSCVGRAALRKIFVTYLTQINGWATVAALPARSVKQLPIEARGCPGALCEPSPIPTSTQHRIERM